MKKFLILASTLFLFACGGGGGGGGSSAGGGDHGGSTGGDSGGATNQGSSYSLYLPPVSAARAQRVVDFTTEDPLVRNRARLVAAKRTLIEGWDVTYDPETDEEIKTRNPLKDVVQVTQLAVGQDATLSPAGAGTVTISVTFPPSTNPSDEYVLYLLTYKLDGTDKYLVEFSGSRPFTIRAGASPTIEWPDFVNSQPPAVAATIDMTTSTGTPIDSVVADTDYYVTSSGKSLCLRDALYARQGTTDTGATTFLNDWFIHESGESDAYGSTLIRVRAPSEIDVVGPSDPYQEKKIWVQAQFTVADFLLKASERSGFSDWVFNTAATYVTFKPLVQIDTGM